MSWLVPSSFRLNFPLLLDYLTDAPGSATVRFSPLQRGQLQAPLFQDWERHLSHHGRLDELFLLFSDSKQAGEDQKIWSASGLDNFYGFF